MNIIRANIIKKTADFRSFQFEQINLQLIEGTNRTAMWKHRGGERVHGPCKENTEVI